MKQKGRKGVLGAVPVYEESFKIAVAREYITGKFSYGQLARKYQLDKADTVRYFVRWYKEQQEKWPDNQGTVVLQDATKTQLEQQLAWANLRITALEMLIQNANKELGIDIIKKSGTKQQDK
jgi:transposase-like protein